MDLECPGCGEQKTIDLPSKSSAALAVCLSCGEIIVIYKECVVCLDKHILASGSVEEKRRHVAAMILEFVQHEKNAKESVDLDTGSLELPCLEQIEREEVADEMPLISSKEAEDFCRIDLNLIDKEAHFTRIFG